MLNFQTLGKLLLLLFLLCFFPRGTPLTQGLLKGTVIVPKACINVFNVGFSPKTILYSLQTN